MLSEFKALASAKCQAELISKCTKETLGATKVEGMVLGNLGTLNEETQFKGLSESGTAQQAYKRVVGHVKELEEKETATK